MTQKTIDNFINEIYSQGSKKNDIANRIDVYHIEDIWSLCVLDLKYYGPQNISGYRYIFVVVDKLSKDGWTIPLKNKSSPTKTNSFETILVSSIRFTNLIETNRGKNFLNKVSLNSSKKTTSKDILETFPWEQCLLKGSNLLLEISLKDLIFLKKMAIGLT